MGEGARWQYLVTGTLLFLVGAGVAGGGAYKLYVDYEAVLTHEPVDAVVQDSWIEYRVDQRGGGFGASPGASTSPVPFVNYSYTYEGTTYTGTRLEPDGEHPGKGRGNAQSFLDRYSNGSTVTAYVDPDDPSESFLVEDAEPAFPALLVVVGLLPLYVGVGMLRDGVFGE